MRATTLQTFLTLSLWMRKVSVHMWALSRIAAAVLVSFSKVPTAKNASLVAKIDADSIDALFLTGEALAQSRPWGKPGRRLRSIWIFLTIWLQNLCVFFAVGIAQKWGGLLSRTQLIKLEQFAQHALEYYESPLRGAVDALTGWRAYLPLHYSRRLMWIQKVLSYAFQHAILAFVHVRLVTGDISQNLHMALDHYAAAADIITLEKSSLFAPFAALVLAPLGVALLDYPTENRTQYARRAIEVLSKAKDLANEYGRATGIAKRGFWKQVGIPFFLSRLDWKLGIAHQEIGELESAIAHFDLALRNLDHIFAKRRHLKNDPTIKRAHVNILVSKGFAHLAQPIGNPRESLHLSIGSFSKARALCKQLEGVGWSSKAYALSLVGDARAYIKLEALGAINSEKQVQLRSVLVNQLRKAARLSRKARAYETAEEALLLLGRVFLLQGDKARAWRAFAVGSRIIDRLQRQSRSCRLSSYWAGSAANLYELLVRSALECSPPEGLSHKSSASRRLVLGSAFSHLERGRTLFLQRELANREPLPKGAKREDPLLMRFFLLRRQWLETELSYSQHDRGPESLSQASADVPRVRDRLSMIETRYLRQLDLVRQEYDDADYDPDRFTPPITYRHYYRLVEKLWGASATAVIEYFICDRYLIVALFLPGYLVIKHAGISRIELDEIQSRWQDGYKKLIAGEITILHWEQGYLGQVLKRVRPAVNRAVDSIAEWEGIAQHRIKRVVVIPHGFLHLIPLHAVELPDGRIWGDTVRIQYAPSASVLLRLLDLRLEMKREASESQRPATTVAIAYSPSDRPLIFNEAEARAVAKPNRVNKIISGTEATSDRVKEAIHDADYIHFACHGALDATDPFKGGLSLASRFREGSKRNSLFTGTRIQPDGNDLCCGDRLMLGEIFHEVRLPRARLVVLSACETGLSKVEQRHEEYIGLPAGFLHAGATTVISSLWPVADVATWLLMRSFAKKLRSGLSSSRALQESQSTLRALSRDDALQQIATVAQKEADAVRREQMFEQGIKLVGAFPFASPYWWAGFIVSGVGNVVYKSAKSKPTG